MSQRVASSSEGAGSFGGQGAGFHRTLYVQVWRSAADGRRSTVMRASLSQRS